VPNLKHGMKKRSLPKCSYCFHTVTSADKQVKIAGRLLHAECAVCEDCKCRLTDDDHDYDTDAGEFVCRAHFLARTKSLAYA
jgi:hypothetical protein